MSAKLTDKQSDQPVFASPSEAEYNELVEVISRSQHNYRDLIDNLDHAVFTLALDGEIRVANRCLSELLGVSFQHLIGRRITDFIEVPTHEQFQQLLPLLLKTESWVGTFSVCLRKDREPRQFHCWVQALSEDGRFAAVTGWARDVTSERQSEVRFAELFETLREGIFLSTPDGKLLDANPALVRMLGFDSKKDLQARNVRDMYVDPSQRDLLISDAFERGSIQDRAIVLRRKDGQAIHCLNSCAVIRDAEGRVLRIQGTLVDVSERLEMEKHLHKEQEFVRSLVASFPDVIAVLNLQGACTFMSPRVQDVLGLGPEEFVGKVLGGGVHPDDLTKLKATFQKVATGQGTNSQFEYRALHADGSWRMLRASASPLYDANGKINGVVASARDVTESKTVEQQLMQKEKLAAMGEMMTGVAHELNNPLTAILGISDLIRERAVDDAMRHQVETVLKQARRAATIVQNLLVFSRPSILRQSKIQLDQIVKQALDSQRTSLQQKKITVEFQGARDLPPIQGDAKLLVQGFSNLISNAEQAISAVRESGTLRISTALADGKIVLAFSDDGPGISPENLGKIFDPFFTTRRPSGGTGLGLTISQAIVKEHGGKIEVESSPGAGTTFRVLLPGVVEEIATEAATVRGTVPPPRGSAELRGHSVFIVDDEESIREIVQEGLAARGMIVEGASSSEEALSHLVAGQYEFVLCDFNLPGLNGEQLFERVRSQAKDASPRFVFMTGALLDPARVAQFQAKGASVLQKPFHVAALATLLTQLLQGQTIIAK
ncbi:MAG TPA: PAS domain S-box protein [Candidatus Acidoferrales bacterium]|nr:PAS domain S-box protein [Candidatus Acidoferrales bacterium]